MESQNRKDLLPIEGLLNLANMGEKEQFAKTIGKFYNSLPKNMSDELKMQIITLEFYPDIFDGMF